jgi:phytol kinase
LTAGAGLQLVGLMAVALWLLMLALAALAVRRHWPEQREWSRKVVHIGTGPVVLIAWATGIHRLLAIPAAASITLVALLNHRYRLLPAIEDVGRHSYGTIAYGAAITTLLAIDWPHHPQVVAAGVLVMALGDGLAGLLGPLLPTPTWQFWGQTKSVGGTGVMLAASLVALLSVAAAAQSLALPAPPLPALLGIAAAATLLEQLAVAGLDNFSVPVGVALLWRWWMAP